MAESTDADAAVSRCLEDASDDGDSQSELREVPSVISTSQRNFCQSPVPKRIKYVYCEHCLREVSEKTYRNHCNLHFSCRDHDCRDDQHIMQENADPGPIQPQFPIEMGLPSLDLNQAEDGDASLSMSSEPGSECDTVQDLGFDSGDGLGEGLTPTGCPSMLCQKLAAQPTLHLRVANFVEKFPSVRTNSHAQRTRGNRVLVTNADVVMSIVDTNFALLTSLTSRKNLYAYDSEFEGEEVEEIWEDIGEADEIHEHMSGSSIPLGPQNDPLTNDPLTPTDSSIRSLVLWLTGFLLLLQARYFVSDAVIDALLKFLCVFCKVLGNFSQFVAKLAIALPTSVYRLRKTTEDCSQFTKSVVCPKCHRLYRFEDCTAMYDGRLVSKKCNFVLFPNHPHDKQRAACGCVLLKAVILPSGRRIMYPLKVYPYKCLLSSLQRLLLRPDFVDLCQHWQSRTSMAGYQCDIYDGKIWNDFQIVDGKPFLSSKDALGLGLMLNVDWFQPFKHTTYSVGAVYLIMNLPRSVRFKRRNVILVGILPGPSEPKRDINSYMEPLVEELEDLWKGVRLRVNSSENHSAIQVRCALLCVACDLPAGRKLCGFLSHSAKLGCSKCLKEFPGGAGSLNYSGFDRATWRLRTDSMHRTRVHMVGQCVTKAERTKLESELGCRYSILLRLPYFDAPRMLALDPMHNLFLGTGKHMLQFWLDNDIIHRGQYSSIQTCVDQMVVPADVGRVPYKIASGFSGFTADQFKNWIILFSMPALYDVLPPEHLQCWQHFVLACRILCKHQLSQSDIDLFDALLMRFCLCAQALYGEHFVTPNMHMHAHLKSVVEDYGPVFEYWLFSFERYNGILGSQPNNHRDIESQLLNRFLRNNFIFSLELPQEFREEFVGVCSVEETMIGSLHETAMIDAVTSDSVEVASCSRRGVLDADDSIFLLQLYKKLKPGTNTTVINSVYDQYTVITYRGRRYGVSKGQRQFVAMAEWDIELYGAQPTPPPDPLHPFSKFRPVKILRYIKVSFSEGQTGCDYLLLAVVAWFSPHKSKDAIGKPAQVWCCNQFEIGGMTSFLPVHLLQARCAHAVRKLRDSDERVTVVVPLVE